jgi:hypothetical protein
MTRILSVIIINNIILITNINILYSKDVRIPKYSNGQNSIVYNWAMEDRYLCDLKDILNLNHSNCLRIWIDSQIIQISNIGENKSECKVVNYIRKINKHTNARDTIGFSSESILVHDEITNRLVNKISENNIINSLIEDTLISTINQLDGELNIIEYSDSSFYIFKIINKLNSKDVILLSFVNEIKHMLTTKIIWNSFINKLPKGYYRTNNKRYYSNGSE